MIGKRQCRGVAEFLIEAGQIKEPPPGFDIETQEALKSCRSVSLEEVLRRFLDRVAALAIIPQLHVYLVI
jgi:hypothetical protein